MNNPQEMANWRERPSKNTEKTENNTSSEFRGSPHVYKDRYAPTRDVPYGQGNHNPRFNERPSQSPGQSASLRRQEFLNTSPLRNRLDGPKHKMEEHLQKPVLQTQPQFQERPQSVNGNKNCPQPVPQQRINPNLQPQFQQRPHQSGNVNQHIQQPFPQHQQQPGNPNLQPQFQQRPQLGNGNQHVQQPFPQQVLQLSQQPGNPNFQQRPQLGNGNQHVQQPFPQQQQPGNPNFQQRPQFGNLNQPIQQQFPQQLHHQQQQRGNPNRNQNFKQPQNQQTFDNNSRQPNGNHKSEQQFSGLSESSSTKYRDQRIKQMASMNQNEIQKFPKKQQQMQNSRPNERSNQMPQQRQPSHQGKNQRPQSSKPENKSISEEFITKGWIVQPIISNEILLKKYRNDDPNCQTIQEKTQNGSTSFRDKRIQHNSNKTQLENSYNKMNSVPTTSLSRIGIPEVKYYPKKTLVTFRPKSNSHVLLTSATSMNTIFIRSFKMNKDYCATVKAFNEMGKSGVPFKKFPEVNGMVLTHYKNVSMRAHVIKTFDDHVEVFFTDLGYIEKKTLPELINVNILAHTSVTYIHQYRLKNIPDKSEKSEEVLQYLQSLYEHNFEIITDNVGKECDLIDYQTEESVCSRILSILGIKLPEVVESEKETLIQAAPAEEIFDEYIDADLYGPENTVNIKDDFVDQDQSNSSESFNSDCEKAITEKNNNEYETAKISLEKNEEKIYLKNNKVEKTYEMQSNYETSNTEEQLLNKGVYQNNDFSENQFIKATEKIPEKEEIATLQQEQEHNDEQYEFEESYEQPQPEDTLLLQNISKLKITEGKQITVIVSDKSELRDGSLSIMNEADYRTLKKLQEEIQIFCENDDSKSYKPGEDEICLAKYSDGKWYRATCLKYLSDTKTICSFIDLGNLSKVYNIDIKKCPRNLNKPCFSVSCFIEDLDEVTPEMEARLNELIPLEKFIVDEIKYVQVSDDEEICVIELKNIVRILREEGLMF